MFKSFSNKLISVSITVFILFSFSISAFADDEVGVDDSTSTSVVYTELPDSMLPVTVTDSEAIEADLQLRQVALDIANVMASASDSGTRAIDYPAYIYSILNACYDSGNQRLWVNDYSLNNKITTTNSYLNDIVLDLESTTYGIIPKLASMIQTQNSMYNRLDEISDYTSQISAVGGVSDTLFNIYTFLVGMMQNTSDEGYLETITNTLSNIRSLDLAPIKTGINNINTNLGTINTSIGSSNTYLNNLYTRNHTDLEALLTRTTDFYNRNYNQLNGITTNISNVRNDITSFKNANHTDINSFQSDFNNINWTPLDSIFHVFDDNGVEITNNGQANSKYFSFQNVRSPLAYIYRFRLPITVNSRNILDNIINNIVFYNSTSNNNPTTGNLVSFNPIYSISPSSSYIDIFILANYFDYNNILFKFPVYVQYSGYASNFRVDILKTSDEDFYKVADYVLNYYSNLYILHIDTDIHNIDSNIDKLRRMYASDDELAAKEAQQGYETSALNDFTGNGSAAVNSSDSGNVKNISGTVKSGLNTGGSVSGGLGIFQNDNSFWGWFSNDCASWFTPETTRSNNLLYKVKPEGELITTLPDLVTERDSDYFELLGR